jgi:GH24 family phage-related lysozyme (muramidase)
MHVLTVCYGHPADPAAFDAHYTSTHAQCRKVKATKPGIFSASGAWVEV